jgi:hypothetical protein
MYRLRQPISNSVLEFILSTDQTSTL